MVTARRIPTDFQEGTTERTKGLTMRFGIGRGVRLAALLSAVLWSGLSAEAGIFRHSIPRETLAKDYRTGDVMYAPPIPYGEYTKDYVGCIHGAMGTAVGAAHGLAGKLCGLCKACGACGGPGCGSCGGLGHNGHGDPCGTCGGDGCKSCGAHGLGGLFHHGDGGNGGRIHKAGFLGHGGNGGGLFHHGAGDGHGHGAGTLCGPGQSCATPQTMATAQSVAPSAQSAICGMCKGAGRGCGACGGRGLLSKLSCGLCGGKGRMHGGDPCGGCGGKGMLSGCGLCGGKGCGACGGLFGHHGNKGCSSCGGRGCGLCAGLKGKLHGLMGLPGGLLHHGGVEYFVGPGGPVPITPGYVPYVVPVRSPRDYFAFPPFSDTLP